MSEQFTKEDYEDQWAIARDDEIEVRTDLRHARSPIQYRRLADIDELPEWQSTPFQRAAVSFEADALALVSAWLEDKRP